MGRSRSPVLVRAGGAQRLVLGGLMGTQQPQVTTSVLRHQPLATGDGVLGGWWGAEGSCNIGSFAQALERLPGDAVGFPVVSSSWQSHCCSSHI